MTDKCSKLYTFQVNALTNDARKGTQDIYDFTHFVSSFVQ